MTPSPLSGSFFPGFAVERVYNARLDSFAWFVTRHGAHFSVELSESAALAVATSGRRLPVEALYRPEPAALR